MANSIMNSTDELIDSTLTDAIVPIQPEQFAKFPYVRSITAIGAFIAAVVTFIFFGNLSPSIRTSIAGFSDVCRHVHTSIADAHGTAMRKNAFMGSFPEPSKPYIIVSTYDNTFKVKEHGKTIREGKCSTGSYILLKSQDRREWIFQTPRGRYSVTTKVESPVWHKPDWAFIEEGESVPPIGAPERDEPGVLGDFALHFGNGYMIHGTLYQRFLGLPVTHGCIRMGDEDLEFVFNHLDVGSFVFIY